MSGLIERFITRLNEPYLQMLEEVTEVCHLLGWQSRYFPMEDHRWEIGPQDSKFSLWWYYYKSEISIGADGHAYHYLRVEASPHENEAIVDFVGDGEVLRILRNGERTEAVLCIPNQPPRC